MGEKYQNIPGFLFSQRTGSIGYVWSGRASLNSDAKDRKEKLWTCSKEDESCGIGKHIVAVYHSGIFLQAFWGSGACKNH